MHLYDTLRKGLVSESPAPRHFVPFPRSASVGKTTQNWRPEHLTFSFSMTSSWQASSATEHLSADVVRPYRASAIMMTSPSELHRGWNASQYSVRSTNETRLRVWTRFLLDVNRCSVLCQREPAAHVLGIPVREVIEHKDHISWDLTAKFPRSDLMRLDRQVPTITSHETWPPSSHDHISWDLAAKFPGSHLMRLGRQVSTITSHETWPPSFHDHISWDLAAIVPTITSHETWPPSSHEW